MTKDGHEPQHVSVAATSIHKGKFESEELAMLEQ